MTKVLKGRSLSKGIIEAEALKKLKVADRTHELYRKDVTGKVLIFPYPIGTTTLGFVLLESIVRNVGPKAIVCEKSEPLMSSGAIAADIFFNLKFPIVDQINFSELEKIENGTLVKVNGDEGYIEIY